MRSRLVLDFFELILLASKNMKRSLFEYILKDIPTKLILLSGPRQTGKTTLSKMLFSNHVYLNYDNDSDRKIIEKELWDRNSDLIILDEIHKKNKWKAWLKGIYDVEGLKPMIIATGSARLDTFRKVGDSLAGRYFSFRLHPFDLKELYQDDKNMDIKKNFLRLLEFGGFPEPFIKDDKNFYRRWKKSHIDIILRQDLISLEKVTNITGIENLIRLLRTRVGSTISYTNLAQDLSVDPKTVKNWLRILESLFVVFKVTPYSKKIRDTLLKAPKYYFFDNGQVEGDQGIKLENLVACALYKELQFLEDCYGEDINLHFIRNKKGQEIDFLPVINGHPVALIEVKWSDDQWAKNFVYFEKNFPNLKKIQLVGELNREKTLDKNSEIRSAAKWLTHLKLMQTDDK